MLNMYNSERKGDHCAPMSPRISFSNDFVDTQLAIKKERSSREAPESDFEFSVSNYSMMSADELFSKGRLLPFKDNCNNQMQRTTTTLREELLVGDEDEDRDFSLRPPKGSTRWKGLLGLRKSHIGSKKLAGKTDGSTVDKGVESRSSGLVHEAVHVNIASKEMLNEGG
ncbi:SKI/DACH domain-containing protein 1 [Quillaja saponaria]|uniref:SKI/DACH domain-containing protein 1 n=1 Tax=Quillaja saponaria TaxID=32244 RepID=A0AAD7PYM5_QUISA|nr:SKI/DACH domain-containing protein 1 [Quillaja saponaria]